jgi:transposase
MTDFIGIDIGDKINFVCILNNKGEILFRKEISNTKEDMREYFQSIEKASIVFEVGSHSPWISRLLIADGHDVFICNPRKLAAVSQNLKKSDEEDSLMLAQLLLTGKHLLSQVHHANEDKMRDFLLIKSRKALVKCRTILINTSRGVVKSFGERISPNLTANAFHKYAGDSLTSESNEKIKDLIEVIGKTTEQILLYEKNIDTLIQNKYPVAQLLQSINGVGPLTSLTYVLTIDDPKKFPNSRTVGAFLGLVPRRDQSGNKDKQLPITKAGSKLLRSLLINCANYILSEKGEDNQIKRFGLKIRGDGTSKTKNNKAKVAVARKLSVIMHKLWITNKPFASILGKEKEKTSSNKKETKVGLSLKKKPSNKKITAAKRLAKV